jgi:hypothetical protein
MLADDRGPGAQGARERADRQVVEAGDRVAEGVAPGAGLRSRRRDG